MTGEQLYRQGRDAFTAGHFAAAERCFRQCAEQFPDNADLLNALGSALEAQGALEEAGRYIASACSMRPDCAVFHYNLANLLRRRQDRVGAEDAYLSAIQADQQLVEALHGLGSLYLEDGRVEPAESCLRQALQFAPAFAPAQYDLGQLLQRKGDLEGAELCYKNCLSDSKPYLPASNALGMLLLRSNRLEEARSLFNQAIAIDPSYLQARCNLAVLDTWCGSLDEAINAFYDLLRLAPEDGDIHFNLSLALLTAGKFEEGWQEHEWRFRKSNPVQLRHEHIPRWRGEPLSGKTILLHAEQGYGDSLQFIRYAPLLARRGATVMVEGQDAIITPLLTTVSGVSVTLSRGEPLPLTPDFQVPMMSLASAIGTDGWPPPSPPYLNPSPDRIALWRQRLSLLSGLKVGIAWAGRPEHQNDANRSIPPELCAPLGQLEGISWISLQFGSDRPKSIPVQFLDLADKVADFCDSAALVSALDLVVTVDSAVAHLAGAMGVPVWLLLPWNPDWRWMRYVEDSIWYPTMKIYRQASPDGWPALIENIVTDISSQITGETCHNGSEQARQAKTEFDNGSAETQLNLAVMTLEKGAVDQTWHHLCQAIALNNEEIGAWRGLVNIVQHAPDLYSISGSLRKHLADALTRSGSHHTELTAIASLAINRDPFMEGLIRTVDNSKLIEIRFLNGELSAVFKDPLLISLCLNTVVSDHRIERMLTAIRRMLLLNLQKQPTGEYLNHNGLREFICALATLCFTNEYIFSESDEETQYCQQLFVSLADNTIEIQRNPALAALAGCYLPLYKLPSAELICDLSCFSEDQFLADLLRIQISEPLYEKQLAAEIPCITDISNDVSKKVARQYEEHPYPRWNWGRLSQGEPKNAFANTPCTGSDTIKTPQILVAGCGTGQHVVCAAARFPGARIQAIDLSLASLAYARRKAEEMGYQSISFMQGDILKLNSLKQQFDMIECGGVLHHMEEPEEGLDRLLDLLKPGGTMGIGLYSRKARRYINNLKKQYVDFEAVPIARRIRSTRQHIMDEPASNESQAILGLHDFYTMSGCRDLLFHVQEHQFDLPQIAALLQQRKLTFIGFQLSRPTIELYRNIFPADSDLLDLSKWTLFEDKYPDTFLNMYQFYVIKA